MMAIVKANDIDEDTVDMVTVHMRGMPVKWREGNLVWAAMDDAFEFVRGSPIDRADANDLSMAFAVKSRLIPSLDARSTPLNRVANDNGLSPSLRHLP